MRGGGGGERQRIGGRDRVGSKEGEMSMEGDEVRGRKRKEQKRRGMCTWG